MTKFTDAGLKRLKPDQGKDIWVSDQHARRGEGRLVFRLRPNGSAGFYFRQRNGGRNQTLYIGRFQSTVGDGGLTVADATKKFKELSANSKLGDVKVMREIARAEQRAREDAHRQQHATGTLEDLCLTYAEHLKASKKVSAATVRADFERDVMRAFPGLAAKQANTITPSDVQAILARLVKAGATRSVNKLRSNLVSAFNFGVKHEHSPLRLASGQTRFALTGNPALLVARVAAFDRPRARVLSEQELRRFWSALGQANAVHAATLRLALLLGGQRIEQLLRVTWDDYDGEAKAIRLYDSKGKGATRVHIVPVLPKASEQLELLRSLNWAHDSPFSVNGKNGKGVTRLRMDSLSGTVGDIAKAMDADFTMRDLRRTVETMLSSLGVDRETRAQLLSHGRATGVQGKHYDQHTYLREKTQALSTWHARLHEILTGESRGKVVSLRA